MTAEVVTLFPAPVVRLNPRAEDLARALRLSIPHEKRNAIHRALDDTARGFRSLAEEGFDLDHMLDLIELLRGGLRGLDAALGNVGGIDTEPLDEVEAELRVRMVRR